MNKKQLSLSQLALVVLLIAVIAIAAVPGYLSGKWSWADLPRIDGIERIKNVQKTGVTVPGWRTIEQKEGTIGGNQWSYQRLEQSGQEPIELFLMPQDYYKNHPQVEWTDIRGFERWQTDGKTILQLSDRTSAKFFKAWNQKTYAVVQWYAWNDGGNYSSLRWFFADQWAQLSRRRVPWIAVSLKIPIDPLGKIEATESLALSTAQAVQSALEQKIFKTIN